MSQHGFECKFNDEPARILMGWDRPLQGFFMVIEQVAKVTEDECVASGRSCQYGPHGPHGETQCLHCGEDDDDDGPGYIYSNLADVNLLKTFGNSPDLSYFTGKLSEFGMSVPPKMLEEILADSEKNVGNRVVEYNSAGEIVRDM